MAIICFTLFVPKPSSTYRFWWCKWKFTEKRVESNTSCQQRKAGVFKRLKVDSGKKDIQTENWNIHVIFKTIGTSNKILFNHT